MNRTSSGLSNSAQSKNHPKKQNSGLLISKAIPGFIQYKGAEGLSPRTLVGYEHDLNLWLEIQGDWELQQVTTQELREYLNHMRSEWEQRAQAI
jgi:integrase/recombinase XerD